jgi:mRNA interferase MazF
MKRGEIWTLAGGPGYAGKPRPALILQTDLLPDSPSLLTCGFTSRSSEDVPLRPLIEPTPGSGLRAPSNLMSEKITAVPRARLGRRIGLLSGDDMARVERALLLVLGFGD